jgi:cytidylate kinase
MKHIVITVGCEYGSGGPEIGKAIAQNFGIEYYDRDLVDRVVEKIGVERELVEKADEGNQVKHSFDTKFGPRYANLTNVVIQNQFDVIEKLAEESSCVIIGRCADYILKERSDVLNIFIYAPREIRVKTVMEKQNVSRQEADEMVKYYDELHHARYKYMTRTYRGDRTNRDILIDSSMLGWDKTVKFLSQLIELRFED